MKTITIDFTTNKPIEAYYSGEKGENNAVELRVIPSDDMTSDERIVTYYVAFKVEGGLVLSETFSAGQEILVPLGVDVTNQRRVCFQLIAISEDGETVVSKSPIVSFFIGDSLEGDVLPDPITGDTIYTEIAALIEAAGQIDLTEITEKLDTIETGAQKNVQSDWNETDTLADDFIQNKPSLATVATSGDYNDLSNKPTIPVVPDLATVATTGDYDDLIDKPNLATVATTGNYNDLTNKPDVPEAGQGIKIVKSDGTLAYTPAEIYAMWTDGKELRGKYGQLIVRVDITSTMPASYEMYYLEKNNYSPYDTCLYRDIYDNTGEPQSLRVFMGRFSEAVFTTSEKTKLDGIEDYAEVNDVIDVRDSNGNSLVSSKIAVIPSAPIGKMIEITDPDHSGYSLYTGNELYSALQGETYCYDGRIIVGMSVLDGGSYFIYYFAGGAVPAGSEYNCTLRRIVINDSKLLSNDALCGSFSKNDYTSSEKTKLSGIATGAQVNVIEKIKDSNGTELTITDKAVTLPAIPAAQIQSDWSQTDTDALDYIKNKPSIPSAQIQSDYAQSNSSAVDYIKNKPNLATVATSGSYNDLSDKPTIPTAGTIKSGSTGYATGGDVYTAIGNIPQIPVGTNTGDILVWNGSAWVAQQPSGLPAEYQKVEYISNSGTAYIDTGFTPNQDTCVKMIVKLLESNAYDYFLFGARESATSKTYGLLISESYSTYRSDYGNELGTSTTFLRKSDDIYVVKNKNATEVNGATATATAATFTSPVSLYLFKYNNNGSEILGTAAFRLYSCKIFDNGTLTRDYVPCYRKVDSVAGLYDKVNNTFTAGNGTIVAGPES